MTSRPSVRAYLAGLVAIFVAAAGAQTVYSGVQADRDARDTARRSAEFAAKAASRELGQSIVDLRKVVTATAAIPGIEQAFVQPKGCSLSFEGVGPFPSGHIDLLRPDGSVACSSRPPDSLPGYGRAEWAKRVRSGSALVGPVKDARTGAWVVLVGAPVKGGGAVVGFLDVEAGGRELTRRYGGARRLEFLVTNSAAASVVTRSVDPARWTGASLRGTAFAGRPTGVERTDLDGRRRIYGDADVEGVDWRVHAGARLDEALASARRLQGRERSIILVGLLVILAATLVVYGRIANPIRRLSAEARAAAGSDRLQLLSASGPAEVVTLAEDFNSLVTALRRELAERAAAEEAAVASERHYRLLFEGSPVPMFVYDAQSSEFLEANEAAVAAFGRSHDELLEMRCSDVVEGDGEVPLDASNRWRLSTKDGRFIEAEVSSHAVSFKGRDARFVIAEDVTERERLELQQRQSQRLESLGSLAGGVAHDFNNLLSVILNYASFVEEVLTADARGADDERWRDVLRDVGQISAAGERGAALTRQLLSFARREVTRPRVLDLGDVVSGMEEFLRRTLGEHVELETALAEELWPVLADPGQMEQVLMNLAVNARDAMPNGGRLSIDTANVEVDADYAASRPGLEIGRYVRVRVSDTGVGMSRDVQARAFEPFFTTKPAGEGTGLGLATTYGIIMQSGGRAQLYSEPGLGTTFTALLPAVDEPAETIGPVAERPRAGGAETVLVVEDEEALLAVTVRILTRNGYEALVASDGPSAIELAAAHDGDIDVVLTDIVMPRMLGTELADELVARHPGMRVIFTSGYARGVLGPIERLPGTAVVIDKPFSETMVLDALREVLDGQRPPPVGEASPAGASELGHGRPAAP